LISIKLIALTYSNQFIFLKIQEKEQRQQENREGGEGRAYFTVTFIIVVRSSGGTEAVTDLPSPQRICGLTKEQT
jgi:hypothetical protein